MSRLRLCLSLLIIFPFYAFQSMAQEVEGGFEIVQLDEIEWDLNSTELQRKYIVGHPEEEGIYIYRVRFPAGMSSRAHYHTADRFITVIEGSWFAGTDSSEDMARATPIKAGGHMFHPAGLPHYDGAIDVATVVEIKGVGPVETVYVKNSD